MRAARGFSLLEVLMAFALLTVGLGILVAILGGGLLQVRQAGDATGATLHAQSLLDQVGVATALQPEHRDGDFEDGRYRWTLDIDEYADPLLPPPDRVDLSAPRLLQLTLVVQWGEGDDPRRKVALHSLRLVRPNPLDPYAGAGP